MDTTDQGCKTKAASGALAAGGDEQKTRLRMHTAPLAKTYARIFTQRCPTLAVLNLETQRLKAPNYSCGAMDFAMASVQMSLSARIF